MTAKEEHLVSFKSVVYLLFSSLSLPRILILLLLLMSNNVYPNPGPIFSCSVCTGNVTWSIRLVQCCTWSIWVYLRWSLTTLLQVQCCRQLSLLKLSSLLCRHFSWGSPTFQYYDFFFEALQHVYLHCSICPPLPMQSPKPPSPANFLPSFCPHHNYSLYTFPPSYASGCSSTPPNFFSSSSSDLFSVPQWNAGSLQARSTELLSLILFHPVDLICIEESNLHPASSFWIPGFFALTTITTTLAFFLLTIHTPAVVSSFSLGRACFSLNPLPPFSLSLIPTLTM